MSTYIQFAAVKFRNNMAYRFEYIMGILNTVLNFLVYWCIGVYTRLCMAAQTRLTELPFQW